MIFRKDFITNKERKSRIVYLDDQEEALLELLQKFDYILATKSDDYVAQYFSELEKNEMIFLISNSDVSKRVKLFNFIKNKDKMFIFEELERDLKEKILRTIASKEVIKLFLNIDITKIADILEDVSSFSRRKVLQCLAPNVRDAVVIKLKQNPYSAKRLMHDNFYCFPRDIEISVLKKENNNLFEKTDKNISSLIIVDDKQKPIGEVSFKKLFVAPEEKRLEDLLSGENELFCISEELTTEDIIKIFQHNDIDKVIVVNNSGKVSGVIYVTDILDLLEEENEDEFLAVSGVYDFKLENSLFTNIVSRFPWLLLNMSASLLLSSIINIFSASISKMIALAVFMPLVASMGGNAGIQSMAVMIRKLSTYPYSLDLSKKIFNEIIYGFVNGILLAIIINFLSFFILYDIYFGLLLSATVFIAIVLASLIGALVPLIIHRMDIDPASASPIFVTSIMDIISFVTFLGLANLVFFN